MVLVFLVLAKEKGPDLEKRGGPGPNLARGTDLHQQKVSVPDPEPTEETDQDPKMEGGQDPTEGTDQDPRMEGGQDPRMGEGPNPNL